LVSTAGGSLQVGTGTSNIGGTLNVGGTINGATISLSNEIYAANAIATGASGYIGVGTGTSNFNGLVNFASNITAVSGVFSGVVNATGGGTLGGVVLVSSGVTAGNGANFASGPVTCGAINASGSITAPSFVTNGSYMPLLCNAYLGVLNSAATAYVPVFCGTPGSNTQAATILNQFYGSLGTNGYKRIADQSVGTGYMIIQWGQCVSGYGIGISFPIAFPNVCLNCVISEAAAQNATWGGGDTPTLHAATISGPSGFVHWTLSWVPGSSAWANSYNTGQYIAIGY
jgi:hypothetical protein